MTSCNGLEIQRSIAAFRPYDTYSFFVIIEHGAPQLPCSRQTWCSLVPKYKHSLRISTLITITSCNLLRSIDNLLMASWGGRQGTTQVVIVFVFLGLAFIILSLRLFTRVIVTRNHGPEDWVITAAFVGLGQLTCRVLIADIETVLLDHTSSTCTRWYVYSDST